MLFDAKPQIPSRRNIAGSRGAGAIRPSRPLRLTARWLFAAQVKLQGGRDPDLRDGLHGFVLHVLASASWPWVRT
jgi:hypothetical protein